MVGAVHHSIQAIHHNLIVGGDADSAADLPDVNSDSPAAGTSAGVEERFGCSMVAALVLVAVNRMVDDACCLK